MIRYEDASEHLRRLAYDLAVSTDPFSFTDHEFGDCSLCDGMTNVHEPDCPAVVFNQAYLAEVAEHAEGNQG